MKKVFLIIILLCFKLSAQEINQVKGNIKYKNNELPLPMVSITNLNSEHTTISDFDGNYKLNAKEGDVLKFSFIGMADEYVTVEDKNIIDIQMSEEAKILKDDFELYLGVNKSKRKIGYSIKTIYSESYNKYKNNNFVANLSGKFAGVDVSRPSYVGSGVNVNIRGINSITGNNQPLYLIDGVPINNRDLAIGSKVGLGAMDYGNIISDINSDDIEDISVIKDGYASIYGYQAINGLVLLKTKKGLLNEGFDINFSTSLVFNTIDKSYLPKYQNQYGAGTKSQFDKVNINGVNYDVVDYSSNMSWGPIMNKQSVLHWDAFDKDNKLTYLETRPFSPSKNDVDKLFEIGTIYKNYISISGGEENVNYRFSYTNYNERGIFADRINKNTLTGFVDINMTDEFKYFIWSSYIDAASKGRVYNGNTHLNPIRSIIQASQRQLDYQLLKKYKTSGGKYSPWNRTSWDNPSSEHEDNPYFIINEYFQRDNRRRFLANTGINYNLFEDINFMFRVSIDTYNQRQREGKPIASVGESKYVNTMIEDTQYNLDFILSGTFGIVGNLNAFFIGGFNQRNDYYDYNSQSTKGGLKVKGIWNISNSASNNIDTKEEYLKKNVESTFMNVMFSYEDLFHINASFRNDWIYSEFQQNKTAFYPSGSFSFILSELFENKLWIPYIKLKMYTSKVINSIDISQMTNSYQDFNNGTQTLEKDILIDDGLKPESKISIGAGIEVFFKDDIRLDFNYYDNTIFNQIADINLPITTGYKYKKTNIGDVKNRGFELELFINSIKTESFSWDIVLNWSKNINKLLIDESVELARVQNDLSIWAVKDQPYGTIRGTDYVYNGKGQKIIDVDGYYKLSPIKNIGNINPDWLGSIKNTFSYKSLSFSFLIHTRNGGSIYSGSSYYSRYSGLHIATVGNNENGKPIRDPVDKGGGVLLDGVKEDGNKNSKRVPMNSDYYKKLPKSAFIYDATYFKLREVNISYNFGNIIGLIGNTTVSFFGKNLLVIKNAEVDSEYGYGIGNIRGVEFAAMPPIRSWGFSLSIDF